MSISVFRPYLLGITDPNQICAVLYIPCVKTPKTKCPVPRCLGRYPDPRRLDVSKSTRPIRSTAHATPFPPAAVGNPDLDDAQDGRDNPKKYGHGKRHKRDPECVPWRLSSLDPLVQPCHRCRGFGLLVENLEPLSPVLVTCRQISAVVDLPLELDLARREVDCGRPGEPSVFGIVAW